MFWGALSGGIIGFILSFFEVDSIVIEFLNLQSIGIASNIIYYAFWIALGGVLGYIAGK